MKYNLKVNSKKGVSSEIYNINFNEVCETIEKLGYKNDYIIEILDDRYKNKMIIQSLLIQDTVDYSQFVDEWSEENEVIEK